jgi:hypothetical protein
LSIVRHCLENRFATVPLILSLPILAGNKNEEFSQQGEADQSYSPEDNTQLRLIRILA